MLMVRSVLQATYSIFRWRMEESTTVLSKLPRDPEWKEEQYGASYITRSANISYVDGT